MNNNQYKKEYSEEDIHKLLKKESGTIKPSEMLLQSTLNKLPRKSIPSPYRSKIRAFVFNIKKMSLTLVVLMVIVGGAGFIFHTTSHRATTNFNGQLSVIDIQMNNLNVDNATIDQALSQE